VRDRRVWQFIANGALHQDVFSWFWMRFVRAASLVVGRWGPCWTRKKVGRHLLGVWILAALWIFGPARVILMAAHRMLGR
jgi:hypothetical protein